ncbi:MAG: glycosyl hydrolase family 28-related protein, partial [Planctomycetota bacterium]
MYSLRHIIPICLICLLATASATAAEKTYNVLDYGAKPDGKTLSTVAIQRAIDACAGGGGGSVRLPAGTFLSGALRMKSRVTLLVDKGATLLGSRNRQDYYGPAVDPSGREKDADPVFRNLIHGENLH